MLLEHHTALSALDSIAERGLIRGCAPQFHHEDNLRAAFEILLIASKPTEGASARIASMYQPGCALFFMVEADQSLSGIPIGFGDADASVYVDSTDLDGDRLFVAPFALRIAIDHQIIRGASQARLLALAARYWNDSFSFAWYEANTARVKRTYLDTYGYEYLPEVVYCADVPPDLLRFDRPTE